LRPAWATEQDYLKKQGKKGKEEEITALVVLITASIFGMMLTLCQNFLLSGSLGALGNNVP
jgi:hypothetical protein